MFKKTFYIIFMILLLACSFNLSAQGVQELDTALGRPGFTYVSQVEWHGEGSYAELAGNLPDLEQMLGEGLEINAWEHDCETFRNCNVRIDLHENGWSLFVDAKTTVTFNMDTETPQENGESGGEQKGELAPVADANAKEAAMQVAYDELSPEDEDQRETEEEVANPALQMQEQNPAARQGGAHRIMVGAGYAVQNVGVALITRVSSGHGWGGKLSYSYFIRPHLLVGADLSYNRFSYEVFGFSEPYHVVTLMPRLGSAFELTPHASLELDFGIGADYRAFEDQSGVFPAGGLFVRLVYGLSPLVSLSACADVKVALQQVLNPSDASVDVYVQAGLAMGVKL